MDTRKPFLIYSAIMTPDGTVLESRHRHDMVTHCDANGEFYMLDGGLDYQRVSRNNEMAQDLSIWSDAPHEIIRDAFKWTRNYDENMRRIYPERKALKDLNSDHIRAILDGNFCATHMRSIFENELNYRK